ncbi:hypothetical protein BXZ70DRAFT_906518 [Cristinia sonorae]|uniref:Uncharacterized protein n=1 Tax=Cristinia sonorae TaxID=1940300 RepID=A0A8K0US02_9AGAR|nr:hypothetical protein BXZ70DRAFT_906518 [Cristinia sonorae]
MQNEDEDFIALPSNPLDLPPPQTEHLPTYNEAILDLPPSYWAEIAPASGTQSPDTIPLVANGVLETGSYNIAFSHPHHACAEAYLQVLPLLYLQQVDPARLVLGSLRSNYLVANNNTASVAGSVAKARNVVPSRSADCSTWGTQGTARRRGSSTQKPVSRRAKLGTTNVGNVQPESGNTEPTSNGPLPGNQLMQVLLREDKGMLEDKLEEDTPIPAVDLDTVPAQAQAEQSPLVSLLISITMPPKIANTRCDCKGRDGFSTLAVTSSVTSIQHCRCVYVTTTDNTSCPLAMGSTIWGTTAPSPSNHPTTIDGSPANDESSEEKDSRTSKQAKFDHELEDLAMELIEKYKNACPKQTGEACYHHEATEAHYFLNRGCSLVWAHAIRSKKADMTKAPLATNMFKKADCTTSSKGKGKEREAPEPTEDKAPNTNYSAPVPPSTYPFSLQFPLPYNMSPTTPIQYPFIHSGYLSNPSPFFTASTHSLYPGLGGALGGSHFLPFGGPVPSPPLHILHLPLFQAIMYGLDDHILAALQRMQFLIGDNINRIWPSTYKNAGFTELSWERTGFWAYHMPTCFVKVHLWCITVLDLSPMPPQPGLHWRETEALLNWIQIKRHLALVNVAVIKNKNTTILWIWIHLWKLGLDSGGLAQRCTSIVAVDGSVVLTALIDGNALTCYEMVLNMILLSRSQYFITFSGSTSEELISDPSILDESIHIVNDVVHSGYMEDRRAALSWIFWGNYRSMQSNIVPPAFDTSCGHTENITDVVEEIAVVKEPDRSLLDILANFAVGHDMQ